jgi:hypothetical protein
MLLMVDVFYLMSCEIVYIGIEAIGIFIVRPSRYSKTPLQIDLYPQGI